MPAVCGQHIPDNQQTCPQQSRFSRILTPELGKGCVTSGHVFFFFVTSFIFFSPPSLPSHILFLPTSSFGSRLLVPSSTTGQVRSATRHSDGGRLPKFPIKFPFVVLFPQCWWDFDRTDFMDIISLPISFLGAECLFLWKQIPT